MNFIPSCHIQVSPNWEYFSCAWLFELHRLYSPWISGQNTGEGIFLWDRTRFPYCRRVFVSHKGSPYIPEVIAIIPWLWAMCSFLDFFDLFCSFSTQVLYMLSQKYTRIISFLSDYRGCSFKIQCLCAHQKYVSKSIVYTYLLCWKLCELIYYF